MRERPAPDAEALTVEPSDVGVKSFSWIHIRAVTITHQREEGGDRDLVVLDGLCFHASPFPPRSSFSSLLDLINIYIICICASPPSLSLPE